MSQKPSDLLLSVIDFFGILIPGAILAFRHGDFIRGPLGLSMGSLQSAADWIPAFFIAFVQQIRYMVEESYKIRQEAKRLLAEAKAEAEKLIEG